MLNLIRKLLSHKEVRYLLAGGASEAIEFFSFLALLAVTHMLYLSNSVSFALGVISGFIFHKIWSFAGDHEFKTHYQLFGYVSLAIFNFFMINLIVGYLVNGLHVWPAAAKIIGIGTTVTWSYLIVNKIIFRHQKPSL